MCPSSSIPNILSTTKSDSNYLHAPEPSSIHQGDLKLLGDEQASLKVTHSPTDHMAIEYSYGLFDPIYMGPSDYSEINLNESDVFYRGFFDWDEPSNLPVWTIGSNDTEQISGLASTGEEFGNFIGPSLEAPYHHGSHVLHQYRMDRVPLRFIISSVHRFSAAEEIIKREQTIRKREEELNAKIAEIEKEEEEIERRKEVALRLTTEMRQKAVEIKRRKEELMKRGEELERREARSLLKAKQEEERQREPRPFEQYRFLGLLLLPIFLFLEMIEETTARATV